MLVLLPHRYGGVTAGWRPVLFAIDHRCRQRLAAGGRVCCGGRTTAPSAGLHATASCGSSNLAGGGGCGSAKGDSVTDRNDGAAHAKAEGSGDVRARVAPAATRLTAATASAVLACVGTTTPTAELVCDRCGSVGCRECGGRRCSVCQHVVCGRCAPPTCDGCSVAFCRNCTPLVHSCKGCGDARCEDCWVSDLASSFRYWRWILEAWVQ
jgi:hypothetical protein